MTPETTQPLDPFKFYRYRQNNPGGRFDKEMPYVLYVEAQEASVADAIAETKGVYFEGCDDGRDCSCCGDRWSRAYGKGMTEEEVEKSLPRDTKDASIWRDELLCPVQVVTINAVTKTYNWPQEAVDE